MRPVVACLWLVLLVLPGIAFAGANSVVDALAAGNVVQFSGRESVSQAYEFDLTIATSDKNLAMGSALGQPIVVPVAAGRAIAGMIERIEQVDATGAQGLYRLHIASSLNRLKYRSGSRTFYGKKPGDIVMQILTEAGIPSSSVEFRLAASQQSEQLTVQYQETDFAFVSRLLEAAGIHYHVEATPAGDKVVFGDGNGGFPMAPIGKVAFAVTGGPAINSFTRGLSLHSGQIQAGDYNWETPTTDLTSTVQGPAFVDLTERMFPAGIETKPESLLVGNLRLQARIADAQPCGGESTYPQLQAGQRVVLVNHPRADFNQEYVITAVEHQRTGKEYRNTFRCLPVQFVFRPLPVTSVPKIGGVMPAIVVGPPGETKHVDKYGRVMVRFPWRSPAHSTPQDPGDAGFIRVAQIAAGTGAAALWLPEVGDEVLVAFEHGDPRHPVVIGSVYNAKDMPPVALPGNKHLSIFRQQSANGVNELVYDGKPGNERLVIQSGPNILAMVNATSTQGPSVSVSSGGAQAGLMLAGGTPTQAPSVSITSGGDVIQRAGRALTVDAASDLTVKSGQTISVTGQKDAVVTVAGNTTFTTGMALKASVGADTQVTVAGSAILESAKDVTVRAGQNFLFQSAGMARLTTGLDAVIQTGKSFVTNSGAMFQFVAAETGMIKTGDASFLSRKDGTINIIGKDVSIVSSGVTSVKSSGDLVLKGSKIVQN
jgi:type VI secretion system secreted protein VgrG